MQNTLYTLLSESESGAVVRLLPDSVIYRSHFPDRPVTPGVCVVRMVRELLGRHLGVELALVDALNVKFLQVIDPVEYPEIIVRFLKIDREDGGVLKVSAAVSAGETTLCKLSLKFR